MGSRAAHRQRMGVDVQRLRAVSWLRAVPVLPRLFGRLFRWPALRAQGRLAAHLPPPGPAVLPQLVPPALSVFVRYFPDCEGRMSRLLLLFAAVTLRTGPEIGA